MKRLSLILALLLCLTLCSEAQAEGETSAQETFTSGDYTYTLLEDGTARITKYGGKESDLVIPSVLDGVPVTGIGDSAFSNCGSLISVTVPDSVTTIGHSAFYRCPDLTVTVGRDSYAARYCQDNGIPYTYPDSSN